MKKQIILPAYQWIKSNKDRDKLHLVYCQLICEIPYGMVAIEKDLLSVLKKAYNVSELEIVHPTHESYMERNEYYPYWRLLSDRGHLHGNKDAQRKYLTKEGHKVIQSKPETDAYIVDNYKDKLYKFENLDIHVYKTDIEIKTESLYIKKG